VSIVFFNFDVFAITASLETQGYIVSHFSLPEEYTPVFPRMPSQNFDIFCFREFPKHLNTNLPFYYWTTNEHYREDPFDNFDVRHDDDDDGAGGQAHRNTLFLHRVRRNQRPSLVQFVTGRAFLPARNVRTIRQEHHHPGAGETSPSGFMFPIEKSNQ